MDYSDAQIWAIILALALGSFALRYSFLGLIGQRQLPEWALRHLRYTAVAVIPGLIAPLVLFPTATGGAPDPARLLAAAATLAVGLRTKSVLWAILGGAFTLFAMLQVTG
jgi:branched-subunit amino acid transport protein